MTEQDDAKLRLEFDESVGLNDARPSQHWVPTVAQIELFSLLIRLEKGDIPGCDDSDDVAAGPDLGSVLQSLVA